MFVNSDTLEIIGIKGADIGGPCSAITACFARALQTGLSSLASFATSTTMGRILRGVDTGCATQRLIVGAGDRCFTFASFAAVTCVALFVATTTVLGVRLKVNASSVAVGKSSLTKQLTLSCLADLAGFAGIVTCPTMNRAGLCIDAFVFALYEIFGAGKLTLSCVTDLSGFTGRVALSAVNAAGLCVDTSVFACFVALATVQLTLASLTEFASVTGNTTSATVCAVIVGVDAGAAAFGQVFLATGRTFPRVTNLSRVALLVAISTVQTIGLCVDAAVAAKSL